MRIVRGLESYPPDALSSAVALGAFDGVHLGHRAILGTAVAQARRGGLVALACTFGPHPPAVLQPARSPPPITSPDDRRWCSRVVVGDQERAPARRPHEGGAATRARLRDPGRGRARGGSRPNPRLSHGERQDGASAPSAPRGLCLSGRCGGHTLPGGHQRRRTADLWRDGARGGGSSPRFFRGSLRPPHSAHVPPASQGRAQVPERGGPPQPDRSRRPRRPGEPLKPALYFPGSSWYGSSYLLTKKGVLNPSWTETAPRGVAIEGGPPCR